MVWDGQIPFPNYFFTAHLPPAGGRNFSISGEMCRDLVKMFHFALHGSIRCYSIRGKTLPCVSVLNVCSLGRIWKDRATISGRSDIIRDVHCTINTERCLLNFASQWYNYFYYQTYAGSYYKNAKLLLPVSPWWPSLMIFCLIAARFCSLLHTQASVQIPH